MYSIREAEAWDIIHIQSKGLKIKNPNRTIFILSLHGKDVGFTEGDPTFLFDNYVMADEHFTGFCEAIMEMNKKTGCKTLIKIDKNNKFGMGILARICKKVSSRAYRFFEL